MSGQETTAQGTSAQSQAADTGITVRVESFVGPLDLLLHLCRTNEMDLSRLSLRTITDQYLAHLEAVRFQDLETAGSFMVMAATLIYLKSKLLLPANPDEPEEALDEEGELLKRELEERLREYARVKALGAWLSERESEQSLVYGRTTAELPPPEDIPLEDLSVHLLQRAMQRLIEDQKRRVPRQVEPNPLSVLERMSEILERDVLGGRQLRGGAAVDEGLLGLALGEPGAERLHPRVLAQALLQLALEQLAFLVERLFLVVRVGGQEELRLEVDQGRGHDHERPRHLEVLESHRLQVGQVLVGDRAQRQAREIHLVGAAEMEQQIERADERLDSYGQARGLRDGALGGCLGRAHLFNAGAQKWPPHSPSRADFALAGSRSHVLGGVLMARA